MEVKNYMSRNRLEGKVAFITGAGAGIAKSAARIFASEGAKVALAEINVDAGRASEEMVRNCGGDAFFIETDVTREDSVKDAIARTVQRFGRLDVLYNCAGGSLPEDSFVTDVGLDIWNRTIALNVLGTILCCRTES